MRRTYGVVWREGTLPLATGKLDLLAHGLRLEGIADSSPTVREIAYESLAGVRVGRASADQIEGRSTILLDRRNGPSIRIATLAQPMLVGDIAELLAFLQLGIQSTRRTAFVVPLKEGAHGAVRDALAAGPPFDPEKIRGLDRHEVFLTPHEAVFLFESPLGAEGLETLLTEPELWKAAAGWRDHIAGPPRIAEDVFSWTRTEEDEELSTLPTPGPGDSEGGDIFSPTDL